MTLQKRHTSNTFCEFMINKNCSYLTSYKIQTTDSSDLSDVLFQKVYVNHDHCVPQGWNHSEKKLCNDPEGPHHFSHAAE